MNVNDAPDKWDDHRSRLASVGQIAAGIAHEVRNPLTAVKGFLQLLQKQSPHSYIEIAQQELDNAIATLQNLLHVSREDLEDEPMTKLSLCAELESILNLFQDQLYRVTIEKHFEHEEAEIVGRRNQLKKAFFNILKNAFEAISGKGTIKIHHYIRERKVCVKIADSGAGIPRDKLALLGTPFFSTKSDGTGMGLAYVFSTVYQHGGTIDVESEEGLGTTFTLQFPLEFSQEKGVVVLDLRYEKGLQLKDFLSRNKEEFEKQLLGKSAKMKEMVQEMKEIGDIDLLGNAHKLVELMADNKELEIADFAQREGRFWAKHPSLSLSAKLEWFQAIHSVLWDFIYNFERLSGQQTTREQFFALERRMNPIFDMFLRHFLMSYTMFKEELIESQQELINTLSVQIIPLTPSVAILPLLGSIDTKRARMIRENVLQQIGAQKIGTLLMDMSGLEVPETPVVKQLFKMIDSVSFMGCKTILTGIRPELADTMANLDISFIGIGKVETKRTLQQALKELGIYMKST
ncbi:ATP-binding protein [Paenibacillus cisolokensis]|uniref:ATP-binding protein n=1 Tax=Paenibacillus cisolokensis TaxID=1658519 RepID=UPI003D28A4B8